jgi:hypothetical protein
VKSSADVLRSRRCSRGLLGVNRHHLRRDGPGAVLGPTPTVSSAPTRRTSPAAM